MLATPVGRAVNPHLTLVVVAASAAVFLLVVARMAQLIRRERQAVKRERALSELGAALVAARSREETFAAALTAMGAVVGGHRIVQIFALGPSGEIRQAGYPKGIPPEVRPLSLKVGELPDDTRAALSHEGDTEGESLIALAVRLGMALPAGSSGSSVWVCPMSVGGVLSAFVLVAGDRIPASEKRSVEALANQLTAALESLELSEQIHRERSETRFQSLIQNAAEVVWVVDARGVILYVSPSSARVLGQPADALRGETLWPLIHPDDRTRVAGVLASAGTTGAPEATEFRMRHADGSWRHLETLLANLVGDPDVGGVVLNSRDVSERKAGEAERRVLQGRLEQAQRLQAIGQLAGGVAHDFNNLLGAILAYARLAGDALEARQRAVVADAGALAKVARDVEKIREVAGRGAALVHDLLIVGSRDAVHPVVLDLNESIAETRELLDDLLGGDIRLTLRLESVAPVSVDRTAIERVMTNLAMNARDAMPGAGELTVSTTNVDIDRPMPWAPEITPGRYVRLTIADTGQGMSDEVKARAFEPFFTTKTKGEGTGLGLAAVYGIVKQARGQIHLYSEPGMGTVFRIYLPAVVQPAPGQRMPALPLLKISAPGGSPFRIMVVDNEDEIREGIRRLLVEAGYGVVTASRGAEALDVLAGAEPIHLLLTDLVMPGMSGRELAERLVGAQPALKVILMSGYSPEALSGPHALSGATLLVKPFTETEVLQAVRKALAPDSIESGVVA
jgi:PAS domain S-box-containing protein